jgi:hypothetical protein
MQPRESWPVTAWTWRADRSVETARLELTTGRAAPGVEIELKAGVPGAAFQVLWDGESLGCFPWDPVSTLGLTVDVDSAAGLHLLELRVLARSAGRAQASPGAVRLLDPETP